MAKTDAQPGRPIWPIHACGAGACAVVTIIVLIVGIQPALDARDETRGRLDELNVSRAQQERTKQQVADLAAQRDDAEAALSRQALRLEDVTQVNQRLARLTRLATDNGVEIETMRPGVAQPGKRFARLPIQVRGAGSFPTCVKFLHALRTELIDTGVGSLTLTRTPKPGGDGLATFECELVWYAAPTSLPKQEQTDAPTRQERNGRGRVTTLGAAR